MTRKNARKNFAAKVRARLKNPDRFYAKMWEEGRGRRVMVELDSMSTPRHCCNRGR